MAPFGLDDPSPLTSSHCRLARISFAPPPQAATLFAKGMDRRGKIDLWIIGLRSLLLDDGRLLLILRVEKAPKSAYVFGRGKGHRAGYVWGDSVGWMIKHLHIPVPARPSNPA